MEIKDLKELEYEELCEKLHNKEIGYLAFVKAQDDLSGLYSGKMKFYGFPENDMTAEAFLEHYEENHLCDDAPAEKVLNEI